MLQRFPSKRIQINIADVDNVASISATHDPIQVTCLSCPTDHPIALGMFLVYVSQS
jgi:hypothetical protein